MNEEKIQVIFRTDLGTWKNFYNGTWLSMKTIQWRKKLSTQYSLLKRFCCCRNKTYDGPPTNRAKLVWRYSCNIGSFHKDRIYARCFAFQPLSVGSFFYVEKHRPNGLESRSSLTSFYAMITRWRCNIIRMEDVYTTKFFKFLRNLF